jgi:hypothetical protein
MGGNEVQLKFDAPAVLRKWPSLNNERRIDGTDPYLVIEGTLDECILEFMAKPESTRHLYEINTAPQPPLVTEVLVAHALVRRSDVRARPALTQFGAPTCSFALVIWQTKCLAISKSYSRCRWHPLAAKPGKSSIRRPGPGSCQSSKNGANFPTVRLNLRYGIFRQGIDGNNNPRLAAALSSGHA